MKHRRSSVSINSLVQRNRRGAVTIVALLTLLVLAGMLGQHVRRVLMERRQFRQEILHLQAEKLAEAGIELADSSRRNDAAWSGMTWNLPAGAIHQTNSAEVVIRMQDETCTVVARYPANAEIPFQVTRIRKLTP
jgi:type II secretory pathway component PulK